MDEAFGGEIRKLLDQFDAKNRAVEERRRRVKADEDDFDQAFARAIGTIVKPAFLSVAALLTERGHAATISEDEPLAEPGPKATENAITLRVAPAGTQPREPEQLPWFSISTRHYNKTASIRSGNVGGPTAGPHGDYQLSQIDSQLIEGELLKFIRAVIAVS